MTFVLFCARNLRSLLLTSILLLWISTLVRPAAVQAQTAVQTISEQNARGTYETGIQQIRLGTTQGVNVSFLRTNETIQRVWLNDPSRVVITFDGCLPQANGNDSCGSSSGASIMQLRQLSTPIEFPEQMVSSSGNQIFLTVVTDSSAGRKIYQFQLVLGSGAPPYALIDIIPAPPPTGPQLVSVSQEYQQAVLSQLSQGLAYAEANGLVDRASVAYSQVVQCVTLMQNGTPLTEAMEQSGVPRALVSQLRSYSSQVQ